jgi:hypothetical protein
MDLVIVEPRKLQEDGDAPSVHDTRKRAMQACVKGFRQGTEHLVVAAVLLRAAAVLPVILARRNVVGFWLHALLEGGFAAARVRRHVVILSRDSGRPWPLA